jgi:hypothetical protein
MEQMIAYCGLNCAGCPAYLATRAEDEKKARETAALLKEEYGIDADIIDVWCDGCPAGGRMCAHCARCEIRPCAIGRGVKNCGRCADFPCVKIEAFLRGEPAARDVLIAQVSKR